MTSKGAGATLRAPKAAELHSLQTLWEDSTRADDPASGPGEVRGWSLENWATEIRVVAVDERPVGVAGVRADPAPDGGMPARVALAPEAREPSLSRMLVHAVVDTVRESGGALARLLVPGGAKWLLGVLPEAGFTRVRTIASMLLPAHLPTPEARLSEDWRLRAIEPGEDAHVLAALNRAWVGTWNFVEITPEMLAADLAGQREGMLLGVIGERIIATCHAMFDPHDRNPDGGLRAWISNLAVDPDYRGRGVARVMLAAGIDHLRQRGATSVALGVDADDPAPFRLYQSVGFEVATRIEAWDAPVTATDRPR